MDVGEPAPHSLAQEIPACSKAWAAIVRRYQLAAPEDVTALLGGSSTLADRVMGDGQHPALESTIKLRKAGFHECLDSEDSVRKWLRRCQEVQLLPPRQ